MTPELLEVFEACLPLRVLLWGYHSYGYKLFVDIDSEGLDGLTAKLSELLILNQE